MQLPFHGIHPRVVPAFRENEFVAQGSPDLQK
jgi:hypothetical protein